MKTIYLWVINQGWMPFDYEAETTKQELENRGIKIGDSATIGSSVTIGDYVKIGNFVTIGSYTSIGESTIIGDSVTIGDYVKIGTSITIGNSAVIKDRDVIQKSLFIKGSRHYVSYWGRNIINIGCEKRSIEWWQNHYKIVGEMYDYSPEQIEEYGNYIAICKTMQEQFDNEARK